MKQKIIYLTRGATVAALYVILTYLAAAFGLDKGVIQFRLSEALCVLPIFLPEAVPGLFIGCLIANLLTGSIVWDVIFGSIATLIGALGARMLRGLSKKLIFLATLPTVVANAVIVPFVLKYAYEVDDLIPYMMLTVGIGEIVMAGCVGTALYFAMINNGYLKKLAAPTSKK